ncbi:MAG: hypothetical protein AAF685_09315 [Cyanobacteria bacterium P01_C01_bin.89]
MADETVWIMIAFDEGDRDAAAMLERQTQGLYRDLQRLDGIQIVERVADPNPPEGNFAGGGWLPGKLAIQFVAKGAGKLVGVISQKLGGRVIAIEVKGPYGGEYKIEVKNSDDFERVARVAQKLALGESIDGGI